MWRVLLVKIAVAQHVATDENNVAPLPLNASLNNTSKPWHYHLAYCYFIKICACEKHSRNCVPSSVFQSW